MTMFCVFCGSQLPEDARFCKHCGAKVESPVGVTEEKKPFNIAMAVTLALYAASFLLAGETSEAIIAVLGLVAAIVLWATGVIKSDAVGWEGLCLPGAVAGLTFARFVGFWAMRRYAYFFLGGAATLASVTASEVATHVESVWGSDALWLWGMLIIALLIRSQKLRRYPWVMLIALGVFLIWSLALTFLYPAQMLGADYYELPAEAMEYFLHCYRAYMGTMFLRRTVVCVFFCFFGARWLGWVRMVLLPVVVTVGSILLITLNFVTLRFGMASVIAVTGGYLVSSLILITVLVDYLKEHKRRSQYHAL